ncbi:MAG TPA: hypothetical protein ENG81_04420 [Candidatus Bathyarchaeota archaeon]|nr:hypothetical protein [Candidatus Bathyarchaeota archaeon]
MISTNEVYVEVQDILNKSQKGFLKPSDYNSFSNMAMSQLLQEIKSDTGSAVTAIVKGKANTKNVEHSIEALDSFFKTSTISKAVGGLYPKPSDFDFFGVTGGLFIDDTEISKVTLYDSKLLQNIPYMKPTNDNPVFIEYEDGYEVISEDWDDDISIYYNRVYKTPIWTYVVINGDIVYDASHPNLQNFELPYFYFNQIVEKILFLAGMNIRDKELLGTMISKENADELIDYRKQTLI